MKEVALSNTLFWIISPHYAKYCFRLHCLWRNLAAKFFYPYKQCRHYNPLQSHSFPSLADVFNGFFFYMVAVFFSASVFVLYMHSYLTPTLLSNSSLLHNSLVVHGEKVYSKLVVTVRSWVPAFTRWVSSKHAIIIFGTFYLCMWIFLIPTKTDLSSLYFRK